MDSLQGHLHHSLCTGGKQQGMARQLAVRPSLSYGKNKARVAPRLFYQDATVALCGSRAAARVFLLPAGKQAEFLGDIQIDQQDVDGLATENTEEFVLRMPLDDIFQMFL